MTPWPIQAAGPPEWDETEQAFVVTRYADVQKLLRADAVEAVEVHHGVEVIAARSGRDFSSLIRLLSGILIFQNAPEHGPRRAFLRQSLSLLGERLSERAVRESVDDLLSTAPTTSFDVVPHLTDRLPVAVMAAALGFTEDTTHVLHADGRGVVDGWRRAMSVRRYAELEQQAKAIEDAMLAEVARARNTATPLSPIVALNDAGPAMEDRQVVSALFFFLMAGIETTAGQLASMLFFAFAHPEEAERLRRPDRMRGFIEEVLRYAPSFRRLSARRLLAPMHFGETELPAGALALPHVEAAQHDPTAFPEPWAFRPGRQGPGLLLFGGGAHACIGAHLARLEARVLLERLLTRDVVADDDAPDWDPHPAFRRLRSLRLRLREPLHAMDPQ